MTFDTEKFIKEIEIRKPLWDPSSEEYTDRDCRRRLWNEITYSMFTDELSEGERREISKLLQQKWRNIRSSFCRELRRRAGRRLAESRKTPYMYFNNLKFLENTAAAEGGKSHENIDTGQEEYEAEEQRFCRQQAPSPQRIVKLGSGTENLDQVLKHCTGMSERYERKRHRNVETDTDKLFMLSLVDDFRNIPQHMKLTTKMEIIRVIKWGQTSRKIQWNPRWSNGHSDHDYVRVYNRSSPQIRKKNKIHPSKYTSSPQLLRPNPSEGFLSSKSDVMSNESDVNETELIEVLANNYES